MLAIEGSKKPHEESGENPKAAKTPWVIGYYPGR
jgi:hypothetical protein